MKKQTSLQTINTKTEELKEKLNEARKCSNELLEEMNNLQSNKGGSRKSRRNQKGGSSDAIQFGCRQPEWTPDCR